MIMCKLIEKLNPREFSEYLKMNYSHFDVRQVDGKYIGTCKFIFGYYAYVEDLDEKRRIVDFCETENRSAILFVE